MSKNITRGQGRGYIKENGDVCMVTCFECGRENHISAIPSGLCCWCGHDANIENHQDCRLDQLAGGLT